MFKKQHQPQYMDSKIVAPASQKAQQASKITSRGMLVNLRTTPITVLNLPGLQS